MTSIKNGLGGLLRFSGRDRLGQFWPYAGLVFLFIMSLNMAIVAPTVIETFSRFERFAAEHPELTTVVQSPGGTSIHIEGDHPELMPDFGAFGLGIGITSLVAVLLLAGAVVRRLHDRGRSGLWGILPLPFLAIASIAFPKLMESFTGPEPDLRLFALLFLNNVAYIASFVTLIVLLTLSGTPGPNRFGDAPTAPPDE